ncbi:MAG: hypothetical protein ABDI20_07275, partial [Candidatus Bipolaricaulaceae bacterium]
MTGCSSRTTIWPTWAPWGRRCGARGGVGPVAVEVRDLEELREALDAGAAWILLDNMDLPTLRRAVALAKGKAFLEASG